MSVDSEKPEPSFRDRALGESPNPLEHIDHLFQHTSRRLWAGVVGLAVLVAAGVLWTVVASQAVTISGPALVVPPEGVYAVGGGQAGLVTSLQVGEGDLVARGQSLAIIQGPNGRIVVTSPVAGRIIAEDVRDGDSLTGAEAPFRIAPRTAPVGIVLVPAASVSQLTLGMPATLTINGVPRARYGEAQGRVSFISPIAVSATRLGQITGDATLLGLPQQLGPLREVRITLEHAGTPSGLAWTRGDGPAAPLPVGVRGTATITIGRDRIITKAFR